MVARGEGDDEHLPLPQRSESEILRSATPDEIARVRPDAQAGTGHFQLCQRGLRALHWPWELIDVETLLDGHTLVFHYLGPHEIDAAPLRAWFRTAHDLDVLFEAVGMDEPSQTMNGAGAGTDGHGCGASGCGHGGCGHGVDPDPASAERTASSNAGGCGTSTHSGCSSCGVMRAMSERNQRRSL